MPNSLLLSHIVRTIRRPGLWFILALLAVISLLHYGETLDYPGIIARSMAQLELDRHAFERILFLAPIVWSGFMFGWKGSFIISLVALACMLPRAIFISPHPKDALFESSIVFIIGNVISISFYFLRKEREHRIQLEIAQREQQKVTEELKAAQQNLRYYLRQAIQAQEEERKRISHELHDDTIQALVVLSRQLDSLASKKEGLNEENRHELEELWQQTDDILSGVRRLSQDLRPAALDRLGLLPALEWLASSVSDYSGIEVKVKVLGKERRLSEEEEIAIFRITQEAMRNIWRHSKATNAEITVDFGDNIIEVTVSDNGMGFELPTDMSYLAKAGKLGLTGMLERAQLIGGKLTIHSQPGNGTYITVELPV